MNLLLTCTLAGLVTAFAWTSAAYSVTFIQRRAMARRARRRSDSDAVVRDLMAILNVDHTAHMWRVATFRSPYRLYDGGLRR